MANVGEKTGKKTQAGRDVYKTPEGEMVSEKSTTFEYKGRWINIPTIHDGKQYSQDQLIDMLDKGLIKPTSTHNKLEEAIKAAKNRSKSLKFNEGGLSKQMDSMLPAADDDTRSTQEYLEDTKPMDISSVPAFQRPMDASTNDQLVGEDDAGNPVYRTMLGNTYTVRRNPDQRTTITKIKEDVLPAVKKYLEDPTAPTADQAIAAAKAIAGDAWETISIPGDLLSGKKGASDVTLGQVFELTGGTAAASTMFDVPGGTDTLRIFGGPGARSYGDASLLRAERLRAAGATPAQIEAETGRVRTGTPEDYIDNKGKTLADISPEYANLIGVRDHMEGYIKDLEAEDKSTWATDYPHIKDPSAYIDDYRRQLAEINKKIAKFEKANPADEAGIVVKPQNPFKFEIDDSQIEIKSSDGAQTLAEATKQYPIIVRNIIPDHKELFKEYPNLEYVEFYVDDAATYAHFSPTRGRHGAIVVNPKLKEKLVDPNNESFRNTFFHELQHAAQFQDERIAFLEQLGGGPTAYGKIIARSPNSQLYEPLINRNEKLVQLKDEIVAIFEKQRGTGALDQRSTGARLPGQVPNPSEVFGDVKVAKQIARKMRELDAELFKTYISTASEIEARIAGNRAKKLGKSPTSRVVSDLSNQRGIETREEYWENKPKSSLGKKKAQAVLKLGSITDEEILRYANGAINFARYAVGIDSDLLGFDASGPIRGNYAKGGLAESKGLSWGELIVDNILGLDNEYESFGEKLGKAINKDEIKFLKDAAIGVYEGTKEFVQAPVETTKQVVSEIKDSVTRLGSEDLNTRLQRMYGVSYEQATDEQVNQAREAVLGDALTALELVPAAKVTTTVASAAIPSGLKADVIGQTKALLSGDKEFLSGTPSSRASTQSLSAGFTGQNPPTYIPKDEPVFDPMGDQASVSNLDLIRFREPIAEFTRKLTMTNSFPNKGITGAEFLRLLEKNAESIPPSSYKEGLVDKDKRYTREELLDAVTKGPPSRPRGAPESLYYSMASLDASRAYENIQRQSEVGFTGYPTSKNSYFSIPIITQTSGKAFKANSQHFDPRTTAHVRGSFVDAMVGYDVNETLSPKFKSIIGKEDKYLLVEEIQSDLLQKGYRKPKNSFDTAFDRAANETMAGTQVTFQEAYGDVTNELKSLIKTLDSKNLEMPEEPLRLRPVFKPGALNRNTNPQFKDRRKRDFLDEIASRGTVDGVSYVDFDEIMDYINKQGVNSTHIYQVFRDLVDKANRPGYLYGDDRIAFTGPDGTVYNDIIISQTNDQGVKRFYVNPDSEDYKKAAEAFDYYSRDFGLNYDELLDTYEDEITKYYDAIDKEIESRNLGGDLDNDFVKSMYERFREIKDTEQLLGDQTNTALPPIRKNRQTVEEALKLLIAKADQQGVDKIVIPPAERIALARGRTIEPDDKGDRFYRTYVTDLDKALKDLEKNYPVTVHRDVELPYKNIVDVNDPEDDIDLDTIDEIFNNEEPFFNITEDGELTPEDQALQNLLAGGADTEVTPEVANQIDQMIANMLQDPTEEIVEETLKDSAKEPSKLGIIIDISKLREQFQVDKPRQFAEGGTVDMNQQMSFAFEDGGLRDDGMMRDPVSGNEVPPGSTAKEVRDDIPAQLSEGEYVVPADVVRYYGVKFFEDLRDNAKMGLQDMEARGRIGGEPVPAGGPMDGDDLSPEELAAIQEMMGMAEGGVVNMYKQQQDLYSAPKQAVGNPTTNMNQGGTVAGYQPGGSVATDQDFLQAGQQAQQRSFAGFPLGATIFPSAQTGQTVLGPEGTQVATTDAIGGGTTGGTATDNSALVTVTLYGPNGEIRTLTLPTDQATYDQLIAQGWSTEMPVAGATSDNDDGGDTEVETDPNAWMNKFSYDDFGKLATQTSETLTKIPFGGAIGLLGNGTKAAQAAANIIVMKANGYDTSELEKELIKFRKETGLNLLPNELTNGDQLAKDIMLKNTMLASSDATDLKGKPLFTDDQDFRDYMSKVLPETVSSPGLSGATAESTAEIAKEVEVMSQPVKPVIKPSSNNDDNDVPSHAEIMEKHYGTSWKDDRTSTQKEASDVGFGSDTGGWKPAGFDWNKGGLMATPKPKKKTRKYNKGGLAGKK